MEIDDMWDDAEDTAQFLPKPAPAVLPCTSKPVDGQKAGNLTDKIDPLSQSRVVSEPDAPAVREPLSDAEITKIAEFAYGFASVDASFRTRFVRAVEQAHGITGDSK